MAMNTISPEELSWIGLRLKGDLGLNPTIITKNLGSGLSEIAFLEGKIRLKIASLTVSNVSHRFANQDGIFASSEKKIKSILEKIEKDRKKKYDY